MSVTSAVIWNPTWSKGVTWGGLGIAVCGSQGLEKRAARPAHRCSEEDWARACTSWWLALRAQTIAVRGQDCCGLRICLCQCHCKTLSNMLSQNPDVRASDQMEHVWRQKTNNAPLGTVSSKPWSALMGWVREHALHDKIRVFCFPTTIREAILSWPTCVRL